MSLVDRGSRWVVGRRCRRWPGNSSAARMCRSGQWEPLLRSTCLLHTGNSRPHSHHVSRYAWFLSGTWQPLSFLGFYVYHIFIIVIYAYDYYFHLAVGVILGIFNRILKIRLFQSPVFLYVYLIQNATKNNWLIFSTNKLYPRYRSGPQGRVC